MNLAPRIWDISEPIEPATAAFPGDTPFTQEWVLRMDRGHSCNVSTIRMSVHVGSHADSPRHYDDNGLDSASSPLLPYLGRCRVIEVQGVGSPRVIPAAELTPEALGGATRVLFRTAKDHHHRRFDDGFTAVGPEAARVLVAAGVQLVGIDTPSVDHATSKDLQSHHVLYAGGVSLLENLDLSAVPEGDYELIALPLRIVGGDASPVRAILRELPPTNYVTSI